MKPFLSIAFAVSASLLAACGGGSSSDASDAAAQAAGARKRPAAVSPAAPGKTPRVLLIGTDGVQYERLVALQNAGRLPNFSRLNMYPTYIGGIAGGASQQATYSGPGWTSLLTGTWLPKHGVESNNFGPSKVDGMWEHLLAARPTARTASFVAWNSIHSSIFQQQMGALTTWRSTSEDDAAVESAVIAELKANDPDLVFAHLDRPDVVGHESGFSAAYDSAIVGVDARIGHMLTAIDARPARANEDWLVLVVTDHGRDASGYNHGGQSVSEKTVFVASNKPANAQWASPTTPLITTLSNLYARGSAVDVTPTVLTWLGALPPAADYRLDGIPGVGPLAVRQLTAVPRTAAGAVSLQWQNEGRSFGSLQVYRNSALLATLPPDAQTYEDTALNSLPEGPLKLDYTVVADGVPAHVHTAFEYVRPVAFDAALLNGLAHYYDFSNGLVDSMGGLRLASAYTGSTAGSGRFGERGLSVDMNKGFVSVPQDLSATQAQYTLGFWMKAAANLSDSPVLTNKDWATGRNPGVAISTSGDRRLKFNIGDGSNRADGYLPYSIGSWVYVAVTVDRAARTLRGYVVDPSNGGLRETLVNFANVTGNVVPSFNRWALNEDATGTYRARYPSQAGLVEYDDVAVWRVALTKSQIAAIAGSSQPLSQLLPPPTTPVPVEPTPTPAPIDTSFLQTLSDHWTLDAGLSNARDGQPLQSFYRGVADSAGAFGGKALSIDAQLGYFRIPFDVAATSSSYTLGFWMKSDGRFTDSSVLTNKDWGTGLNRGVAIAGAANNNLKFNIGDGARRADGWVAFTPNTWVYVALAVDGPTKTMRAYIGDPAKGQLQERVISFANVTGNTVPPYGNWAMNEDATGTYYARYPQERSTIAFDDLSVWRSALSKSQIEAIYTATRPLLAIIP